MKHEIVLSESQQAQLAQLATIENELDTATTLQDHTTQVSLWSFNALGASDAFTSRKRHAKLIMRLEHASKEADAIKREADALVETIRAERRQLALSVGASIHSQKMEQAAKEAFKAVEKTIKEIGRAEAEAKTIEEAEAKAIREADTPPQPTVVKRKTKKQLIAEAA